jgi:pullulanase/glycogen debranching enzyme
MQNAHNFALYSSTASSVTLVLFSNADLGAGRSTAEIPLDPVLNRTGNIWHIAVPKISKDYLYGTACTYWQPASRNRTSASLEDMHGCGMSCN